MNNNHWITVSRSSREATHVDVYDSLPPASMTVPSKAIAAIICTRERTIKLHLNKVQRQIGGTDCGLFALAFATSLCHGENPSETMYIQHEMRSHLKKCLINRVMTLFPKRSRKRCSTHPLQMEFNIYCYCRQPQSGRMIMCDQCHEWFHKACQVQHHHHLFGKRRFQSGSVPIATAKSVLYNHLH